MQRYLDKDLVEKEYDAILRHKSACPECTDMFERLQRLSNDLENLPKVTPPYSIVDAIMPQLLEIDRMNGMNLPQGQEGLSDSAVAIHTNRQNHHPKTRAFWNRHVSWRWASGVVAAGIVLGIFIFQQQPSLPEHAEGQLPEQMVNFMMSSDVASAPSDKSINHKSISSQDIAALQDQFGRAVESAPGQSQVAPPALPPSSQGRATEGQSPQQNTSSNVAPTARHTESSTEGLVDPQTNVQESDAGSRHGITTVFETEVMDIEDPIGSDEFGVAHIKEDNDSYGESESIALVSPDQKWTAVIKQNRVVIMDVESNHEVYTSEHQWDEEIQVELKEWKEDTVIYEVIRASEITQYFIDVRTHTEGTVAEQ